MTALVVVAVMAVHTLARDHLWRYEWLWATYQYHFGVLLIGPVLAGVAAWTGRDAGRARWLILPSGAASDGLRPLTWTLGAASAAYVACWAVPAAIVTASGTADRPGMTVALTFLPALAALAAYTAVGFAVGVAVPRVATAPVVAVATFGLTLLGWIAGFERLVRLGGAGTSMATLRPDSLVQAGQVAWYLAVGVLALVWAHGRLGRPTPRRVWAGRGLGVLAVAVAAGLLVVDRPVLDQVGVERTVCVVSSGVDVCAPAAYDRPLHDLARKLGPPLATLRRAGAPIGERVHIGVTAGIFEPAPSEELLAAELYSALGVGSCASSDDVTRQALLAAWVSHLVGDQSRDLALREDDAAWAAIEAGTDAQVAWARPLLRRLLVACPR